MNVDKYISSVLLNEVGSTSSIKSGRKRLIVVLGLLGDFDSIEYAQNLYKARHLLHKSNILLSIIAIAKSSAGKRFCNYTGIERACLFLKQDNSIHDKIGLSKGLETGFGNIINMILMCAGIGSEGTLKEVIRGYLGDRSSEQIFLDGDNINLIGQLNFRGSLFNNIGGSGFQRPFELATLRLKNMIEILSNTDEYIYKTDFLTQRGGTFLLDEYNKIIYSYNPSSLLGYSRNMSDPLAYLNSYL